VSSLWPGFRYSEFPYSSNSTAAFVLRLNGTLSREVSPCWGLVKIRLSGSGSGHPLDETVSFFILPQDLRRVGLSLFGLAPCAKPLPG